MSQTRKNAVKRENEIVDEAKAEAARIVDRANHDIELEKSKVKDDVKKEMISVATVMAEKIWHLLWMRKNSHSLSQIHWKRWVKRHG